MGLDLPPGLVIQNGQVIFPLSSCAVCVRDNKILLVRQVRRASAPGATYELPGGGIEQGETAVQVALRELREEAGVVADRGVVVMTLDMDLDRSVHQTVLVDVNRIAADKDENAELAVEWVDLDAALEMILGGVISHAPTVVAVLLQLLKGGENRDRIRPARS